jgi:DNA-binding IclR family transcriptional regulator
MPDGTLSRIGVLILSAIQRPATPEEVAEVSGLPLFRARSAIRGLVKAGLLEKQGEAYAMTVEGIKKLTAQKA